MVDPEMQKQTIVYPPRERARNQELILKALDGQGGPASVSALCDEVQASESMSMFAELDWQQFRPDAHVNQRDIVGYLDDFISFWALPFNIAIRFPDNPDAALSGQEIKVFEDLFNEWQVGWLGSDRGMLLDKFDDFIRSCHRPQWDLMTQEALARASDQLARALRTTTDIHRADDLVQTCISNSLLVLLDLPWTRRLAKSVIRRAQQQAPGPGERPLIEFPFVGSAGNLSSHLDVLASLSRSCGLQAWAEFLDGVRAEVANLPNLGGSDGQWTMGASPCVRCAMWFVTSSMSSLDSTTGFVNWLNRRWIFIPAGICTADCWFCGYSAPVNLPAMFFAAHRRQIIYLVPTPPHMSDEDAMEVFRPTIEGIRDRYRSQVGGEILATFDAAAELVTHSVDAFLLAIQTGETVAEDHVFNCVALPTGEGLVWDGEKRFSRVVTSGEFQRLLRDQSRPILTTPEGVVEDLSEVEPGVEPIDLSSPEGLERLIIAMIDLNDAIDARIEEARRTRGATELG